MDLPMGLLKKMPMRRENNTKDGICLKKNGQDMIVRIVKMTFKEEEIASFLDVFEKQKEFIAGFEGCTHLQLLRDKSNPQVFFTYSYWENEEALDRYRASDFFRNIWGGVKLKFAAKPEAWSLENYA